MSDTSIRDRAAAVIFDIAFYAPLYVYGRVQEWRDERRGK